MRPDEQRKACGGHADLRTKRADAAQNKDASSVFKAAELTESKAELNGPHASNQHRKGDGKSGLEPPQSSEAECSGSDLQRLRQDITMTRRRVGSGRISNGRLFGRVRSGHFRSRR